MSSEITPHRDIDPGTEVVRYAENFVAALHVFTQFSTKQLQAPNVHTIADLMFSSHPDRDRILPPTGDVDQDVEEVILEAAKDIIARHFRGQVEEAVEHVQTLLPPEKSIYIPTVYLANVSNPHAPEGSSGIVHVPSMGQSHIPLENTMAMLTNALNQPNPDPAQIAAILNQPRNMLAELMLRINTRDGAHLLTKESVGVMGFNTRVFSIVYLDPKENYFNNFKVQENETDLFDDVIKGYIASSLRNKELLLQRIPKLEEHMSAEAFWTFPVDVFADAKQREQVEAAFNRHNYVRISGADLWFTSPIATKVGATLNLFRTQPAENLERVGAPELMIKICSMLEAHYPGTAFIFQQGIMESRTVTSLIADIEAQAGQRELQQLRKLRQSIVQLDEICQIKKNDAQIEALRGMYKDLQKEYLKFLASLG